MAGDGPRVTVGAAVEVEQSSLNQAEAQLRGAVSTGMGEGAAEGTAKIGQKLKGEFAQELAKSLKGATGGFDDTASAAGKLQSSITEVARSTIALIEQLKSLNTSQRVIAESIVDQTTRLKRASVEQTNSLQSAAKERTQILRNEGSQASIAAQTAGQQQVIAARTTGQQRVAITRGVVDTVGRLEKGLGVTISGIARTTVSAVSKTFSGIGTALGAAFKRGDSEAAAGATSVLKSTLHERESLIATSASKQERLIRESVTRQTKSLESIRTSTQTGLIGAANNRGLFAGIGASLGLGLLARNTFTVGSDFVRGLTVLQESLDLTDEQMKAVRQQSIDLGNDISLPGVSALDAAQAIQTLTKQFGSLGPAAVTAAQAAAKGTLQLARASGASAEDAGALIGAAVNVFGVAADDAVGAADKIAGALTRAAGVSFSDFKDSFVQGATVFEQFVGPTESANDALLDFNTTLAILAKNGITGSNAGAGLKQFFIQATQNTKAAQNASAELAKRAGEVGNVFFKSNGQLRPFNESIDILRKGVQGLSDEARTNLLGDLFGSRSITIANALINSTGQSFAELRTQIAKQGLAAKIAAAQNTGLKGALDALQSVGETVQIVLFEKIQKPLGNAVVAIADFANKILFGAGPALHELRLALLGIAAGIAAMVAIKGAVEVIVLLGKAVALALTPFGALVVAAGILGGALGFLSAGGLSLTDLFDKIKAKAIELGREGLDFLVPKLLALRDFFTGTAIPAIQRFGVAVGEALVTAFHATVNFITGVALPAYHAIANYITGTLVPVVVEGALAVARFAVGVGNAVAGLAQRIFPFIQPILAGFADLGRGIAGVFSGDFGGIGAGFASVGSGIADVATRIGKNIVTALTPLAKTIADFFKNLFTLDNLGGAVDAIATFLNFIGEKVGAFITNPRFLATVGIVAAALAVVAGKWALALVTGLAEGLVSNIPRILNNMGDLLLNTLLSPANLGTTVAVTALLLTVGRAMVLGFRKIGQQSAQSLASGLGSGVSGAGGFLSSLFGGPAGAQAKGSQSILAGLKSEAQGLTNQLRILGSTTVVDPSKIAEARKEVDQLRGSLTKSQLAGLELRDRLGVAFRAIGGIISGGAGILQGLAQLVTAFGKAGSSAAVAFKSGFSKPGFNTGAATFMVDALGGATAISTTGKGVARTFGSSLLAGLTTAKNNIVGGFTKIFDSIKAAAAESGSSIGRTLAGALAGGIAAATAGVALGQQIGTSDGIVGKLIGAGGLASAALAIGAINPAAGVATLAIGGLTAAFTAASAKNKAYQDQVQGIARTLAPDLVQAAQDGKIALDDLKDGLNFKDVGNTDAFTKILESFQGELSTGTQKTIIQALGGSSFIADSLKAGDSLEQLQQKFINAAVASAKFATTFGSDGATVLRVIDEINKPGGIDSLQDALNRAGGGPLGNLSASDLRTAAKYKDAINQITDASGDLAGAYKVNRDALDTLGIQTAFATTRLSGVTSIIGVLPDGIDTLTGSLNPLAAALGAVGGGAAGLSKIVVPPLNIPESNKAVIENISGALQVVIDRKNEINELFTNGVLPPNLTNTTDAVQQAAIAVEGVGQTISETFANGANDFLTGAKVDQALKGFSLSVSGALNKGFTEGDIIDEPTARAKLQPILDAALAGVTDQGVKDQINAAFDNVIVTLVPLIPEKNTLDATQLALTTAQALADGSPIAVGVTAPEIPMGPPLSTAQTFADNSPIAIGVTPPEIPSNFIPAASLLTAGAAAGSQLGQGLANGITSKTGTVTTAATKLANAAIHNMRGQFQITSPSKVFHEIGVFVARGLAEGIESGEDDVVSSVSKLVEGAVSAAKGAVSDAAEAFRGGSSSLFDAFFGSGNASGQGSIGGLQGGITQAFNSLGSTLDDSINKATDILTRSATEALSRADLDILGEAGNSLNVNDVLGASNQGALSGVLDSIVALGKEMIDQGAPISQVTSLLSQYTQHTRDLAAQYGLSSDDVNNLIDQYGLGTDSINTFVRSIATLAAGLGQTTTDAEKLNSTIVDLFSHATGSDSSKFKTGIGVGAAEGAFAGVTTAINGIGAALDGAESQLKAIAEATDPLTRAQLNVAGEDSRSLDFHDVLGVANRAAISAALSSIQDLGAALLEGGSTAEFTTGEIRNQIAALLDYTDSLGFNRDEVQHLADGLGLSTAALDAFLASVQAARDVANQTQAPATSNPSSATGPGGLPIAANPFAPPTPPIDLLPRDITVNLSVPYGDPQAIALAVGNKVAAQIRVLGG